MSKDSGTLFLRNYPDDDALKNPEKYPKSPDIIPLYGAKADRDTLLHPTAWHGFTGMPIVGGDVNHVYIRGHGSGGPHVASLRVLPSELILWPHVWSIVHPVPSGPVVISTGDTPSPHASNDHLMFRAPHTTGHAYSLVANVFKHDSANEHKNLHEYEPIPSFDAKNFGVDDLLSFLSKDKNFTYYNVVVADPTLEHITAHTRLRMFSKAPVPVSFRLDWHKGAPAPTGLEVSLMDDRGKITIPRTPLSSLGEHKVLLDPSYDGILTLNIFSSVGNGFFEPYSGLSLQVFKSGILDSVPPVAAVVSKLPLRTLSSQLLGALNVIFDPHSTRNLRFASPSATQLRESKKCSGNDDCQCPQIDTCTAIPTTRPVTTGWWFQGKLGDPNHFPRTTPGGITADIQPIGTDSDLTAPGLWNALQNPNADYSKDHGIELVGDANNYVFLRGHSTIADIDVQSRIFAITGGLLLHPAQYASQGFNGQVVGGTGTVNSQSISVADANQFYLFNRPFDLKAPPNPNPHNIAGLHYCIVAEARQKRRCSPLFPSWPSEQGEDFKTLQDYENWVMSSPFVCFRNIGWVPYNRKPGAQCFTWTCGTQLHIPASAFRSSFWTIVVECDSPIIPPNSKWTLTCDDNEVFTNNGLCFKDLPISTQSPSYAGCHFTGATPGRVLNLTLIITWYDGGKKIPPPSVKILLAATEVATLSPIRHLGGQPPVGSEAWPFFVGPKYPYIGNHPNPSPLPSFTSAGANTWPYPDSPQFILGHVTLAAKPE